MRKKRQAIPKQIRPFLWSYDIDAMDLEKDKMRILTNVLNFGTSSATRWIFSHYDRKNIVNAVKYPLPGEWNRKSLNFWSLMLDVIPESTKRKIR